MEFRDKFMRAIYLAMEGITHPLMTLIEGIDVIGAVPDVENDEVLCVIHFMKSAIDKREYEVVKKILRIDSWFGVSDALEEICVASYAVQNIDKDDFNELTAILDCIKISYFEGVFMQASPMEIALLYDKREVIAAKKNGWWGYRN